LFTLAGKALKGNWAKNVFTIFTELGQPLMTIAVATTSMRDPALRLAFKALCKVRVMYGCPRWQRCTIDAPSRDWPGICEGLQIEDLAGDEPYAFEGTFIISSLDCDDDSLATALSTLRAKALASVSNAGCIGFDTEWRSPGRNPIALIQLATKDTVLLLRTPGRRRPLRRPLKIPPVLSAFFCDAGPTGHKLLHSENCFFKRLYTYNNAHNFQIQKF